MLGRAFVTETESLECAAERFQHFRSRERVERRAAPGIEQLQWRIAVTAQPGQQIHAPEPVERR